MKKSILGGSCAVIFALGMSLSGPVAADPPHACGPENQGETWNVVYGGWQGTSTIYVFQCWASNWVLMDIQYCSPYGCISP